MWLGRCFEPDYSGDEKCGPCTLRPGRRPGGKKARCPAGVLVPLHRSCLGSSGSTHIFGSLET
eukprot:1838901-Pyramimonas_sp.AAC.1